MAQPTSMESIQERLCAEIQTLLALKAGSLSAATTLQSLGMDSLRFVSLLIAIEKAFGISLMKTGLKREALASVGSLAEAIHAGLKK